MRDPKTITVTIDQLVEFCRKVEGATDYDGCLQAEPEELVAEFFGVEVPVPPKPEPAPRRGPFTDEQDKMFRELLNGCFDKMALSKLVR